MVQIYALIMRWFFRRIHLEVYHVCYVHLTVQWKHMQIAIILFDEHKNPVLYCSYLKL